MRELRLGRVTAGMLVLEKEVHTKKQEHARRGAVGHYGFLTKLRADEVTHFKELEASADNCEQRLGFRYSLTL